MHLPSNKRTNLAIKNIGLSILLKGGSIFISFLLVPMTLGYLNAYEYGIWLTLNSVLSWVYLLDIGLGNGLRNKLTESLAKNDYTLGKIYVSTTFFFMTLIVLSFYALFLLSGFFLDWYAILNVGPTKVSHLNSLVNIVFAFVCIGFLFRMIGNIYMAHQLPAANDLLNLIGNLCSLLIIFILTKTTTGSLKDVAVTFSAVPASVYLLAFPITFKIFPKITPALKYVKRRYFGILISLGLKFMFIQIACIIIFMTSNILISNLFGPEEVTPYNIAFKYFSIITIGFNIILTPIWSAITDAFSRNDFSWIKHTLRQLIIIWGATSLLAVIMILLSPYAYRFWVGNNVSIPISLTILCAVYVIITTFNNIFAYVINGFGTLRIQLIFAIIHAIAYIPLAILCSHHFGVSGILISLCITCFTPLLWGPLQCYKLLNQKAFGIWGK